MSGHRSSSLLLAGLFGLGIVGCSSAPTSSDHPAGSTLAPAGTRSTAPGGPLPSNLASLHNVGVDASAGRTATLDSTGGEISATGADGTAYTLSLPAGALTAPMSIGLYPVTSLATLPAGGSLAAGVQFMPDGLQLHAPATLTIDLPSGTDATRLIGVGWRGDGQRPQRYPVVASGRSVTVSVFHFSGIAVSPADLAAALGCVASLDIRECETDAFLALFAVSAAHPNPRAELLDDLRVFYANVVEPAMAGAPADVRLLESLASPTIEDERAYPYVVWLQMIDTAREVLRDPSFTVAPELAQSRVAAAAFLRTWYDGDNAECQADKDIADVELPISYAVAAYAEASTYAANWSVATVANRLDPPTLLAGLCVQVVIDSGWDYTAIVPGDSGTILANAGFTIGGGPVRTAANRVRLTVKSLDTGAVLGAGDTSANGAFSVPNVVWPDGFDPVKIVITATLMDVVDGAEAATRIQTGDEIEKPAERLAFTFDTDLQGWTRATAGLKGSANWGTVYWLPRNGGTVQFDGIGGRSQPNSWLSKVIILPSNASRLSFDVSAHDRLDADTHFVVRIVDGAVSTILKDEVLTHTGPDGQLSFETQVVDISAWAGKVVTIVFEQDDNGIAGSFPGGDEQVHLDNVRIAAD